MVAGPFWIEGAWPGRLAVVSRPRGGDWLDREAAGWRREGLDVVVSLLKPDEAADLDLAEEAAQVRSAGMEFLSFPIPDRGVPESDDAAVRFARSIGDRLSAGKTVGIHCRQGVGRSPLIAASALVQAGVSPQEALERVGAARGVAVPETREQRHWLEAFAAPTS